MTTTRHGRARTSLAAMVLVLLLGVLTAPPARADVEDGGEITRYDLMVEVADDGTATIDVAFDFAFDEPAHGPYLTFVTRQEIDGDSERYRVLEVGDASAGSSSGAPADLRVETDDDGTAFYIGDEDVEVEGTQSYQLTFTMDGLVNPGAGDVGQDEIYWNAVGTGFEVPIRDASVTVVGPVAPEEVTCFTGRVGSSHPCATATVTGEVGVFTDDLAAGEGLSVVASYPPGTFAAAEPIYEPRRTVANSLGLRSAALPVSGAVALAGVAGVAAVATRRGRDQQYLGVTPGLVPASGGAGAPVGRRRRSPVTVQFTPPADVAPGELGTLTDEVADIRDVTATIIDMAVRGHLTITEVPDPDDEQGKPKDWTLTRGERDWDDLAGYERQLMRAIFPAETRERALSDLDSEFAGALGQAQFKLDAEMVSRGWYKRSPQAVRGSWRGVGFLVVGLGVVGALAALAPGWGVLGIAVIVIGVAMIACAGMAPARTAAGTAVLAQALGFKHYLETAEAQTLRFSESEDLFSRYLPYAIAFDVVDRWTKVFQDLAARGVELPEPGWYVGTTPGTALWSGGVFGAAVQSFDDAATVAITSSLTSSATTSGFSVGSVGGGVGGGGGGSW